MMYIDLEKIFLFCYNISLHFFNLQQIVSLKMKNRFSNKINQLIVLLLINYYYKKIKMEILIKLVIMNFVRFCIRYSIRTKSLLLDFKHQFIVNSNDLPLY